MPEIIQFCNDLCYAVNGTPLDPIKSYPPNRLEPVMVRHVADGYRTGTSSYAKNPPEATAIVSQIIDCINDPRYVGKTIGVISLQGVQQAKAIEYLLSKEVEPVVIEERRLICGDAYTFQGDERDIIFLSMVAAPGAIRLNALTSEPAKQRYNVAVSRAKEQLWLFHTATLESLSEKCLRYRLLKYAQNPVRSMESMDNPVFESDFEREVYTMITEHGFAVRTQVGVGDKNTQKYRIDLVVEGVKGRLAVECDGEEWHGPDAYEKDMARQRDLERAGWQFVRIRGGDFYRDREKALLPLWDRLEKLGIVADSEIDTESHKETIPAVATVVTKGVTDTTSELFPENPDVIPLPLFLEPPPPTIRKDTKKRPEVEKTDKDETIELASTTTLQEPREKEDEILSPYRPYQGDGGPYPTTSNTIPVMNGLCKIIDVEGPMWAERTYRIYMECCGEEKITGEQKSLLNKALKAAIDRDLIHKNDEHNTKWLFQNIIFSKKQKPVLLRERGNRDFEELPPSEINKAAKLLIAQGVSWSELTATIIKLFNLEDHAAEYSTLIEDYIERKFDYT